MTHYVAYFSRTKGSGRSQQWQAVCGAWVQTGTPEPDCPRCLEWIEADAERVKALMAQWDREAAEKVEQVHDAK